MTARLSSLLDAIGDHEIVGNEDAEVSDVTQDSRSVVDGSLYCCVVGNRFDGHDFTPREVVRAGARSLLVERWLDVAVPQVRVPSARAAAGPLAAAFWGNPSQRLSVIGVTGTNGKTTTTHLIASVLRTAGRRTGVIGTLSGQRTTPEAPVLQRQLAGFLDDDCEAVAMEVSSIALDQHRVDGIGFRVGVWTNLTQDHLDYHGDMDAYFAAKAVLFSQCELAVVNVDDAAGQRLLSTLHVPAVTYGASQASDVRMGPSGCSFRWRDQSVELAMAGTHNILNALAAATTCHELGVADDLIAHGLSATPGVPGRWERVDGGRDFAVIVDYAHTPDGLTQTLTAARQVAGDGRVVVVFGCGGDRDRSKRPQMGAVATTLGDVVVLTSDNPRSEDPMAIIEEAASGAARRDNLTIIADRERAIFAAIAAARAGDVVIIAGKGHELGQTIGDQTFPFDDREVARRALAEIRP